MWQTWSSFSLQFFLSVFSLSDLKRNVAGTKMIQKFWQWQTWLQHISGMKSWNLRRSSRYNEWRLTLYDWFFYMIATKKRDLLQSNRRTIMDDPFIRNYIEDLLKNIRTQVLLKLIKPYTRIRIPFISKVMVLFVELWWPLQYFWGIMHISIHTHYTYTLLWVQELNVPEADVEQLLVSLILDNRVQGHIDQVNRLLECGDRLNLVLNKIFVMFN